MKQVHIHEFGKHLIRYKDHRFGKHPRFRYFMKNMIMRHHVQSSSSVFVKRNLQDLLITINERNVWVEGDESLFLNTTITCLFKMRHEISLHVHGFKTVGHENLIR